MSAADRQRRDGREATGPARRAGPEEPVEVPIDGVLDLHQFRPGDAREVVGDYLDACREAGIREVRIIHGKGTGSLRELVHALLRRRADVARFGLAGDSSGWGATVVTLRPDAETDPCS